MARSIVDLNFIIHSHTIVAMTAQLCWSDSLRSVDRTTRRGEVMVNRNLINAILQFRITTPPSHSRSPESCATPSRQSSFSRFRRVEREGRVEVDFAKERRNEKEGLTLSPSSLLRQQYP